MEEDDYQGGSQMLSQGGRGEAAWATMSEEDKKVNTNKLINFLLERDADKVRLLAVRLVDAFLSCCSASSNYCDCVSYSRVTRACRFLMAPRK